MAMQTSQAPWVNLVTRTMTRTSAVRVAPTALMASRMVDVDPLLPRGGGRGQFAPPVPDHPGLGEGEGDEDADDVELDEAGQLGVEGDDQGDRGEGEQHDAVGVDEPVAAVGELARRVPVPGEDGGEHREAVEGGVRGEDEYVER